MNEGRTDRELVEAYQGGESAAFDEIYRRHRATVSTVCRGRLRDPDAASDAVQETFTRVLERLPSLEDGALVGHYLARVAKHVCVDYFRRGPIRREVELNELEALESADPATDVALHVEQALISAEVLQGVGPKFASLLHQHHMVDRTLADIAIDHRSTPGSIGVLLVRARQRAKDFARARDLAALWPMQLLHRALTTINNAARRLPPEAVAALAIAPVVAGVIAGSPGPAPTEVHFGTAPAVGNSTPAHHVVTEERVRALARAPVLRQERPSRASSPAAGRGSARPHQTRAARSDALGISDAEATRSAAESTGSEQRSVVRFEAVDVPGTGRRLQPAPDPASPPDYDYGVSVGDRRDPPLVRVQSHDDSQVEPVHEQACSAAEAVPEVGYCRRGSSGQ